MERRRQKTCKLEYIRVFLTFIDVGFKANGKAPKKERYYINEKHCRIKKASKRIQEMYIAYLNDLKDLVKEYITTRKLYFISQ